MVCRSSGTVWPEIEPRANLEHWYSDDARDTQRGAIKLRDPDADRYYKIDGYSMTGKHDFSNGFMTWTIWKNLQDTRVNALPRLVDDNRRYLQAMGDYFTDQDKDGKPRGDRARRRVQD